MKTKFLIGLIFVLILSVSAYWQFHKPTISLSESQARTILVEKISQDSIYTAWRKIECFHFYTEEITPEYFGFTIREKHGDGCSGDPDTEPVVDRYRVARQTKDISYLDPGGEYVPYDRSGLPR